MAYGEGIGAAAGGARTEAEGEELDLGRFQLWNLALIAAVTLVLFLEGEEAVATGLAFGGLFASANFWLNAALLRRMLEPGRSMVGVPGVLLLLKNLVLWAGTGILVMELGPDTLGFGCGVASILVTATLWAIVRILIHGA